MSIGDLLIKTDNMHQFDCSLACRLYRVINVITTKHIPTLYCLYLWPLHYNNTYVYFHVQSEQKDIGNMSSVP